MPFASDAQRKHFFANNGGGGESAAFQKMYNDANDAIKSGDYGQGKAFENESDAVFSRDYAQEMLADSGQKVAMPNMSQSEKVDWASWCGDFGKSS